MLVLTRRRDQAVRIDGPCRLLVVEVDRRCQQVRLGFDAPPETTIVREELLESGDSPGPEPGTLSP